MVKITTLKYNNRWFDNQPRSWNINKKCWNYLNENPGNNFIRISL